MNYDNIAKALSFYQQRGYVYLEDAPWQVGRTAYYATKPKDAIDLQLFADVGPLAHLGYPVASGEQSFIQMMLDGQPIKRAICVTPCYRYEPKVDMLHRRYFMKAELINAQDTDEGHLIHMIHDACAFFEQFFAVRVVKTPIGYDIVEKSTRFELGSYGIREVELKPNLTNCPTETIRWIYGTACAEPRLSTAIQKFNKVAGR